MTNEFYDWIGIATSATGILLVLVWLYRRSITCKIQPYQVNPVTGRVMLVVPDERIAAGVRRRIFGKGDIVVVTPQPSQIYGSTAQVIIVHEMVDLNKELFGGDSLKDALLSRQATWGDRASLIWL